MAEFDVSAYLGVFLDEMEEQLQILDSEILILEKNPDCMDTIQNIFRAAHTLKGASAAMGFEQLKEVTHYLENIFDQVRQTNVKVTPALINLLFEGIDFIKQLKAAIINGVLESIDITPFIEKLAKISSQERTDEGDKQFQQPAKFTVSLNDYQKNVIHRGFKLGHQAFEITINLLPDALMKNVRAVLIHNNLKEAGEIIGASPAIEQMERDEFDGDMCFILLTIKSKQEIAKILKQISDIKAVQINEITEQNIKITEGDSCSEGLRDTRDAKPKAVDNYTAKAKIHQTVRVDVEKLEHLMNLVGELVIDQTRLVDVRGRLSQKNAKQEESMEVLDEITNHLSRVITELQEGMMKTRMLPIEQLFNRFPRMVRDTAHSANKEIDFTMYGKETELDRTLIEEISDPIIHLLRNAIDHGIESPEERIRAGKPSIGRVELRASHEENHIVISISDDGRGIDPQKVKLTAIDKALISPEEAAKLSEKEAMYLIFQSGLSTAQEVTDISGRGVGMDIVKSNIEKLNGTIMIDSTIGHGTSITIKLPLTLAIIRSLLVKFGAKTFAIPLVNVLEIIRLNKNDIQMIKNQEVGLVRGKVLPLVRMKEQLGIEDVEGEAKQKNREFVVVVGIADKRIGIIADKTLGNQEVVIKSLGSYIGSPPYIAGATIMGDGSVALILDVSTVVREYGAEFTDQDNDVVNSFEEDQQFVTFKLGKEEYGIEIERTKDILSVPAMTKVVNESERLLGMINLRGNMLPVFDLRKCFNMPVQQQTKRSRIIVVEHESQDVGFLVDEVTEVLKTNNHLIEKPADDSYYNHSNLLKGISKINERVVLILKIEEVLTPVNQKEIERT
ncbi:chemotaxis protein CheW [Bacillus rubiinfantis]|uniref:chemotaxis protein CheW n=1 Tax=Bacillus rubiinfantis TaxID=1499680 RepID=UPI0005AB8B62|nr:chemotaxis protein CheW [Bacillus rubiinfantis]